jgi:hypothetical protein
LKLAKYVGYKPSLEIRIKLSKIAFIIKSDPNKGLFITIEYITIEIIKGYKLIRKATKNLKANSRIIIVRISKNKEKLIEL